MIGGTSTASSAFDHASSCFAAAPRSSSGVMRSDSAGRRRRATSGGFAGARLHSQACMSGWSSTFARFPEVTNGVLASVRRRDGLGRPYITVGERAIDDVVEPRVTAVLELRCAGVGFFGAPFE